MCENTQLMCNALTKSIAVENDDIGKIIESLVCCKDNYFFDAPK
jgi:hypothetical protein